MDNEERIIEKEVPIKRRETKERRTLLVIGIVLIVMASIVILIILLTGNKENNYDTTLKNLGKVVYTDFYHPQVNEQYKDNTDERNAFLKGYETQGIKFNLDNLSRISIQNYDVSKDIEVLKECDKENTKVIFYPKSPFDANDVTIDVELDCK